MAFNRQIEMKVGTSASSVIISGLDVSFEITRTRKLSNNVAKFKIYNPTSDTISKVLKKGNSVVFKAGYEDEGMGIIYSGQITQCIPDTTTADHIVSVECGSIQNAKSELKAVTVSLGYKPGTSISRPINEIGTALGLAISGLDNVTGITLPNGFTLAGTAKDAMRYIQDVLERNGRGMFIDNSTLKICKKGSGENIKAVVLSTSTGLLEAPRLMENTEGDKAVKEKLTKRAVFRSLLNYKIFPNGYVQIDYPYVSGNYIVDKCTFKGDNFGGAFEVTGEALGGQASATTNTKTAAASE